MPVSSRIKAADAAFAAVRDFLFASRYGERRLEPGISDFTFGNPHEMPLPGLVAAIRDHALPQDKNWFAYKTSEEVPQAFLANVVGQELGLPVEPPDVALTAGAFGAISVALRLLLDVAILVEERRVELLERAGPARAEDPRAHREARVRQPA